MMEAETGGMQLQSREHYGFPENTRSWEGTGRILASAFREGMALLTLRFQTGRLQNQEKITVAQSHPCLCYFVKANLGN